MYETYEYLPAPSCSEAESQQYFVVDNDGTLLINRQVQYVNGETQEGVIEQPCAVYDVGSQEYFVDIDNTTELISVSDEFVMPNESSNNVYANSYLLQSIPEAQPQIQISEDVVNKTEKTEPQQIVIQESDNVQITGCVVQPGSSSSCTEIALNDVQWRMLEEKGWVQLNINDKTFILNGYGLHAVTSNQKVIDKPENLQDVQQEIITLPQIKEKPPESTTDQDNLQILEESKVIEDPEPVQSYSQNQPTVSTETAQNTLSNDVSVTLNVDAKEPEVLLNDISASVPDNAVEPDTATAEEAESPPKKPKHIGSFLRFKVPFKLKDIPNELFLAKTVDDSDFTAQIIKVQENFNQSRCNADSEQRDEDDEDMEPKKVLGDDAVSWLCENEFAVPSEIESLFKFYVTNETVLTCSDNDIKDAESVLQQLLTVTTTREPMLRRNLLISKITRQLNPGKIDRVSKPVFVPGILQKVNDDEDKWQFLYVPQMIKQIKDPPDENFELNTKNEFVLHVHIFEMKVANQPPKISVTFAKQRILPRKPTLHACGVCAELFTTEDLLRQHQEVTMKCKIRGDQKMVCLQKKTVNNEGEPVDGDSTETTIRESFYLCNCGQLFATEDDIKSHLEQHKCQKSDGDPLQRISEENIRKTILSGDRNSELNCNYCNAKIKLQNFRRHLRSHVVGLKSEQKKEQGSEYKVGPYRCNMCPGTYFHSASLSRHIMNQHINLIVDTEEI